MTLNPNYICLNRLAIFANGKSVYAENFHAGVNIIRGSNSHGKSTIIDFIFYVLGGENVNWKKEAAQCDYVLAEIEVSSNVWTLRRRITQTRLEGIDIYMKEKWRIQKKTCLVGFTMHQPEQVHEKAIHKCFFLF